MIAKIIDTQQEGEIKGAYSKGYAEGRLKGELIMIPFFCILILAYIYIPYESVKILAGNMWDVFVDTGFWIIDKIKLLYDLFSRINIK